MRRPTSLVLTLSLAALAIGLVCPDTPPHPGTEAQTSELPAPTTDGRISLEAAIAARRSVREFVDTALTRQEIGQLAWAAQGITEPDRKFRTAPSAGGLYPLEVYFVTAQGLDHYLPDGHRMERLAADDMRPVLREALGDPTSIRTAPLAIVIAAVYERTATRFGERAERYVHLEVGHAAQNIHLQAVALGLGSVPIGGADPTKVGKALSLPDGEEPVYVIPLGHPLQ